MRKPYRRFSVPARAVSKSIYSRTVSECRSAFLRNETRSALTQRLRCVVVYLSRLPSANCRTRRNSRSVRSRGGAANQKSIKRTSDLIVYGMSFAVTRERGEGDGGEGRDPRVFDPPDSNITNPRTSQIQCFEPDKNSGRTL